MNDIEDKNIPSVRLPDPASLTTEDVRIPLKIRAAIQQMFDRIPGVSLSKVRLVTAGREITGVTIGFKGWSPSLHRLVYDLTVDMRGDLDDEDFPLDVVDAVEPVLKTQTMRHQIAMEYDLTTPLDPEAEIFETRHLTIDAGLIVVGSMGGEDVAKEIVESLRLLHDQVEKEDGPALGNGNAYALHCGLGHMVGERFGWNLGKGIHLTYDGLSMAINGANLSEMALAQMKDKPLSTILAIHPELDRRIIAEANATSRGIDVRLVPEVVPFTWIDDVVKRAEGGVR